MRQEPTCENSWRPQAIPVGLGLPLTTYITAGTFAKLHLCFLTFLSWPGSGPRAGYYFSAAFVLAGTALLSLIDVHKNNLRRRRRRRQNSCRREEEVMGE